MTRDEITNVVLALIREETGHGVSLEFLFKDMHMDSLDRVKMILEVENQFAIDITDGEIEKLICPKDVVDLVERKRNEQASTKPIVSPQEVEVDGGAGKADPKDPRSFPTE